MTGVYVYGENRRENDAIGQVTGEEAMRLGRKIHVTGEDAMR